MPPGGQRMQMACGTVENVELVAHCVKYTWEEEMSPSLPPFLLMELLLLWCWCFLLRLRQIFSVILGEFMLPALFRRVPLRSECLRPPGRHTEACRCSPSALAAGARERRSLYDALPCRRRRAPAHAAAAKVPLTSSAPPHSTSKNRTHQP